MLTTGKYYQKIRFTAVILLVMSSIFSFGQVLISTHNTDFNTNFNGWNNTMPTGFTRAGANYVGTSASTTGGVYAIASSGFGYQPSGTSPATSCSVTGTFKNTTGSTITSVQISYQAFQIVNRTSRLPNWTVTSSLGSVSALNWTFNSGTSAASPSNLTVTLTGLNVANNGTFTVTFASDRGTGSGSSPMIGLNNVKVRSIVCLPQTITAITSTMAKNVGDPTYSVATTSTSGLTVTYTSSNTAVATVNASGTVTIVGAGTATITAAQAGNATYCAATSVTQALTVTAAACTTPNALAFQVQPSNVVQDATMTAVKVKAICTSGGGTATTYTGPITLTLNTPGCGYTAQTVNAVAGVATFSSVSISRSAQTGINFTATASGLTSATSSNFNVTVPAGSATTSVITQNNFDGTTTWAYAAGTPTYAGSGSGTDVTGTKSNGGSNVLCKSFSIDNGSGERASTNTVTFSNVTGLATYDQLDFEFKVVSFGSGTGAGNDSGEDFFLEVSTNGGSSWTTILTESGSSNRLFALSASPVTSLSLANSTYGSGDSKSAFKLSLTGITQFQFRFTAKNNRTNENWGIDDVKLTGTTHTSGTPFNLPTAAASAAAAICNTADGIQLGVSVTSFQAPLTYSWTPTPTLDVATIQNPVAYLTGASQVYSVTITDGDNCKATATVSVTNPGFGGTAGLWTGAQSTDWFDCRNWDDFRVPETTTAVTINQTANDECIVDEFDAVCNSLLLTSSNGTVNNLTLQTTGTLTVGNGVSITNTGSGNVQLVLDDNSQLTCGSLIIDGVSNGDAKLKHEAATTLVTVNGNLTIQPGGELDLSDGTNGTLGGIVHVKGNFVNNATETDFKQDESTIVFNGTGDQDISLAGTNTEIFYNLTVNKATGTVTLSDNIQISNQLTMTTGNINTQSNILELGTSTSAKGTLSYTSGYLLGQMRRWFNGTNSGNASSLFPMGFDQGGIKNRHVSVEYSSAATSGGYLTVQFMGTDMGMSGIPILSAASSGAGFDVTSTENLGYWKIDNQATKLTNGTYKITCTGEGFGTIADISKLTLLKRVVANGPDWFCPGTHIAATGSASFPVLARSGVSGWSNFGFGGGTNNPLPVELVSFTAECGNRTMLNWSTASENNSDYFSVEKTADGVNWNEVAKVQSAGNTSQLTNYTAEDPSRQNNPVYYRLKQVDFNGDSKVYSPISLDCENNPAAINLYPNPSKGSFSVALNGLSGKISIVLASSEGKIMERKQINAATDSGLVEFVENQLHAGVYFVTVMDGNGFKETVKLIVE